MNSLPSGTVTFLITDVEQSTRLWELFPDRMRAALLRHDTLARTCVEQRGDTLVKPRGEGDSLFAVFERGADALAAADFQNALSAEAWDADVVLRVRMALHTGDNADRLHHRSLRRASSRPSDGEFDVRVENSFQYARSHEDRGFADYNRSGGMGTKPSVLYRDKSRYA